jgi:hypothetical protein
MVMYVENLSEEDFKYFSKGTSYVLKAGEITKLDETKTPFRNLKRTWGSYINEIEAPTEEQEASAINMIYGVGSPTSLTEELRVSLRPRRVDDVGVYVYLGYSLPGVLPSDNGWNIERVEVATGNTLNADGNLTFSSVWDDRASLSYS